MSELAVCDPCDGWTYDRHNYRYAADRSEPATLEGFFPRDLHRDIAPTFAKFLPFVRTDWSHWSHYLDWTLESGPDEAPSSIDILIPYSYRGATMDSWTSYGGQPGDPAEVEIGTGCFNDDDGVACEVNLTAAEAERVETYIYENPPSDDYYDEDY